MAGQDLDPRGEKGRTKRVREEPDLFGDRMVLKRNRTLSWLTEKVLVRMPARGSGNIYRKS